MGQSVDYQPHDRRKAVHLAVEALSQYLSAWGTREQMGRREWSVSVPPGLLLDVEAAIEARLLKFWREAAEGGSTSMERLSNCCDAPELGESGFCGHGGSPHHADFYTICGLGGPAAFGCGEKIKEEQPRRAHNCVDYHIECFIN